ncbi:putative anion transporter 6 [Canna indica]|uniref:Anion transporter 6 n=1 Tax=Canna indica TaxID=4628 RepID=A0AAQ3KBU1_9LILI|nr:putative anion transporter 6 [Canna indica]
MTKSRFPKWYLIILLTFICTSVCYIERIGFSVAYTVAADSIGVNQSSKGLILSTFYYGYVMSQVPGGWAAQYIGGRRVLLLSFLLWSLTCCLVPLDASRVNIMVFSRFLIGVAQGFIFPSIHTILAQWIPPNERSRSMSLTTSGMYLGAACSMLLLPSLGKYKGPQSVFLVESALGIMWSILWFRFASDPLPPGFGEPNLPVSMSKEKRTPSTGNVWRLNKIPWKRIISSLPIWAIVVNNFTFHYALYVLVNWWPTYFEQTQFHISISAQSSGNGVF